MDLQTAFLPAPDGVSLAVHELGDPTARPVVLIHGFMSSAHVNWIKYGTAARLAEAGFRCIMPDLRGHGESGTLPQGATYPPDVLVSDNAAILAALNLTGFDLVGFSLGARTAARLVIDGARPRRLVLSGMGLQGLTDWASRRDHFVRIIDSRDTLKRGDNGYMAVQFMRTTGVDPLVMRAIISSFANLDVASLSAVNVPTLVLTGTEDDDNGSAAELASALPDAEAVSVPGNHMSCVTKPDFGRAILSFLTA